MTEYDRDSKRFVPCKDGDAKMSTLKATMASFMASDQPKVGIWWYDDTKHDFFGVYSCNAQDVPLDSNGRRVYPKMHYQTWKKDHLREVAQNVPVKDQLFVGDYTRVPRGRVNEEDGQYVVYVGSWIRGKETVIDALVELYFDIDTFSYRVDEHWELGHGWSGDKFI